MNPRPVVAIAVSHRDVWQASLWLQWLRFLSRSDNPSSKIEQLVVMGTRRVYLSGALELVNQVIQIQQETWWRAECVECPDENEDGYPRSASHLFLRTLEYCERHYPGRSILWVEPDCIPTNPQWFQAIAAEYEGCGHAFMSQRIPHAGRNTSHLMGNAVYPHDWRQRAPRIVTAVDAPDHPMFGAGKGQPWDVWACAETTADMHESQKFQQIFNCAPWSPENLNRLRAGADLFHRCKDGTLIAELARSRYPEFLAMLPRSTDTYQMIGHPSRLRTLGYPDMPWEAIRRPGGWLSTCRPTDPAHAMILRCLAGTKGISVCGTRERRGLPASELAPASS